MPNCAYCGQKVKTWATKHTWYDCEAYLKKFPEGGKLYEKLGGISFGFKDFWEDIEIDTYLMSCPESIYYTGERTQ